MPIGGLDYKRATDVAKSLADREQDKKNFVTMTYGELVSCLTEAYHRGWDEAIRAKEAREERG